MMNPYPRTMTCEEMRDLMPLYESSELSDAMRAAVQQHVDTCEACRMAVDDQAVLDRTVRDACQREPLDTTRVERHVRQQMIGRGRWLGEWWRPLLAPMPALASAALIALMLTAGWQWRGERTSPLSRAAYADHAKDGHELDGWNESPDAIARFVGHELGSSRIPATFEAEGFRLARARLCNLGGSRFVHLVFLDASGEMVSLFVRRDEHGSVAGRSARLVGGVPVSVEEIQGGRVTAFANHARLLLLVSTLPAARQWQLAEASVKQS